MRGIGQIPTTRRNNVSQKVRGVVAMAKDAPVTIETIVIPDPGPGEAVVDIKT